MSKKILVLGIGQNNFLSFLYSKLKSFDNTFIISAPFARELNKDVKNDSWMYDNNLVSNKPSFLSILQSFFLILIDKHTYQTFFFILLVEKKFKKSVHFLYAQIKAKAFFLTNNNFNDFDVFHFHFLQYSYLRELFLIPKDKKIVCTFWGSDLLRTSDILNFYFVKKALSRANIITCQSLELKEIILSKYGRHLSDKIRIVVFPVDEKIYNDIDSARDNKDLISDFKIKYGYSSSKRNILIGHNGSVFNNHLKIIEAFNSIHHKSEVHLIVNLNYALDNDNRLSYKNKLVKQLEQTGISFTLLETFFSKEELAISRLASDIFIHMPISDALSGTMTEMLYANNVVITGSWLPYKTFKTMGLYYHEADDFESLSDKIDELNSGFDNEKLKAFGNKKAIKEYFFSDKIIENWATILN
ncbi:MAG: hypothetical protein ABIQ27_13210 [Flavobacterium sp.]|uniref:hypothetical protein n=1 Tax=Flavobacterium sp. TaxID=239 RepID=UPI00326480AE